MLQFILTIYFLLLFSHNSVHGLLGDQCNIYDLRSKQCGELEICDENTNSCQCAPDYSTVDNTCIKTESKQTENEGIVPPNNSGLIKNHAGSTLRAILVLIFVCVNATIVALVMKRFSIVDWARNKVYSFRRSNYDEFMIGQDADDDPPLR